MERFAVGSIVIIKFPFSDLSKYKPRPALILSYTGNGDFILSQITSKAYNDENVIEIVKNSFAEGSLPRTSYVKPGKLFTANATLFLRQTGFLKKSVFKNVIQMVKDIFDKGYKDHNKYY